MESANQPHCGKGSCMELPSKSTGQADMGLENVSPFSSHQLSLLEVTSAGCYRWMDG